VYYGDVGDKADCLSVIGYYDTRYQILCHSVQDLLYATRQRNKQTEVRLSDHINPAHLL